MDFEFSDDQLALRDNARAVLEGICPAAFVRACFEGRDTGATIWPELAALGWPGLGIAERHGGLGRGFVEVGIVVEELGRIAAPTLLVSTATQFVPLVREAGSGGQHERILPAVAAGERTGAAAVAEDGVWRPGTTRTTARRRDGRWVLRGTKTHVMDGAAVDDLAVLARAEGSAGDEGLGVLVVDRGAATVMPRTVIDPTMPLATVEFDDVEVEADHVLAEPGDPAACDAIRRALEESTAAMALSITAACRSIFEVTLQYAKDRMQFGRPIGSFQAVKHRLADMYLAVERATALCYFAVLAIAEDDERRTTAVAMAKAAAGDCQRLLVKDGLQLHGGIGFTWESDLHILLKRAASGDVLFGSAMAQRAALVPVLGLSA